MNLRLYDNERNNTLIEKEYPNSFSSIDEGIAEHTTYIDHYIGNGFYKEIYFEGVHIGFGNALLRDSIRLDFESDFETIEMHFALKGSTTVTTNTLNQTISFTPHQHNIIYTNGICGKLHWESDQFQLCEINLSPDFFRKYFPQGNQLFDTFRNAIEKGQSQLMVKKHHSLNPQMYQIVEEIMSCKRKGIFKRMFLESKVIELLLLQLEQFTDDTALQSSIKNSDKEKIYAVREFIVQNLDAACTLIDLSHKVGTNEFILKKGFKELFGTTVFGFWNDAKMEQAKLLLTEKNMNVGEVSDQIGYKNQRHFSTAFKKKFGILPSQIRKLG